MYVYVKTTTLESKYMEFMTMGVLFERFNPLHDQLRSLTPEYEKALKFKTIDEAEPWMARNFTLCIVDGNEIKAV